MKTTTEGNMRTGCVAALTALLLLAHVSAAVEIQGQTVRVSAVNGGSGVVVSGPGADAPKRTELAIVPAGASQAAQITAVKAGKSDDGDVLHITAGEAAVDVIAGQKPFVTVKAVRNAGRLEVRTGNRYMILPDFFADDTLLDAARLKGNKVTTSAENFLLQMVDGGDAIITCIWGAAKKDAAKVDGDAEVDLVLSGEGAEKRIAATVLDFKNGTITVGLIENKGVWCDQDLTALKGNVPSPIAWKRPFEARWRGDYLVEKGKWMADWFNKSQSFDFKMLPAQAPREGWNSWSIPGRWWSTGAPDRPTLWQEHIVSFMLYPSVFHGDVTKIAPYVDKKVRGQKRDDPAPHVYERVVIYPLERNKQTPDMVFTPVDLIREVLGQGPCEYVLDVAGVKSRGAGGERKLLADSTCGLWDQVIGPLSQEKLKGKKAGEGLAEKDKERLITALDDMWFFVHAVHDRIREYKAWGAETEKFISGASANPAVKPVATSLLQWVKGLNSDVNGLRFEGPGTEGFWKGRLSEVKENVKNDKYSFGEVESVGQIRNLGNLQDEMVSRCRQYAKCMRQEVSMQDTSDPEVRKFVIEMRERCQKILRNGHPKECL